ncbi:unnamed protein product, partial [Thelazia callipaeda]|uniref:Myb-like domain-containing protein n=1 Tax=Thelazia callipaeda TaxID=103827 RepID=A0A158RD31_THECL
FQFIHSERNKLSVCVEGYREKDQTELALRNWRSTTIKDRINSQILISSNGKVYNLRGVLDQDAAHALGYPTTLVERFKNGFPHDWQILLSAFQRNLSKHRDTNSTQGLNSGLFGTIFPDISKFFHVYGRQKSTFAANKNETRSQSMFALSYEKYEGGESMHDKDASRKLSSYRSSKKSVDLTFTSPETLESLKNRDKKKQIVKSGFEYQSVSDSNKPSDVSEAKMLGRHDIHEEKSDETTLFKMPLLPLQKRLKPISLYNWTLRFSAYDLGHSKLFTNFAFVIVGFRPDRDLDWTTSPVIAVKGNRLLHTETGVYEVIGPINTLLAAHQGFPKEFVSQFLSGFPEDWHNILSSFFSTYIEPQLPPKQSLTISEIHEDDIENSIHQNQRAICSVSNQNSNFCKKITSEEKQNHKQNKLMLYIYLELSLLITTRSGRFVKPRMETWSGERLVYNIRGSPIRKIQRVSSNSLHTPNVGSLLSSLEQNIRKRNKRNSSSGKTKKALVAYGDSETSTYSEDSDNNKVLERYSAPKRSPHTPIRKEPLSRTNVTMQSSTSTDIAMSSQRTRITRNSSTCTPVTKELTPRAPATEQLPPLTPVTPLYGKRGRRPLRLIESSPEKVKEQTKKRKGNKRQLNRNQKKVSGKQSKLIDDKDFDCANVKAKCNKKEITKETVPTVSFSDVESDKSGEGNRNASNTTCDLKQAIDSTPKIWTIKDNTRLKIAVHSLHPQDIEDWEKVAKVMRARTAEECRIQAMNILKINITPVKKNRPEVSANVVEALRKAKSGTLEYKIQADRFNRQFIQSGDTSDFFNDSLEAGPSNVGITVSFYNSLNKNEKIHQFFTLQMPSVTIFDSDDSLLSVLRTPTPKPVRRNAQYKKLIRISESPSSFSSEKMPVESDQPLRLNMNNEVHRRQQIRYVHRIMKANNQYNRSRRNNTKPPIRKEYQLDLPEIRRKQNDSDKESEDEYFEEN